MNAQQGELMVDIATERHRCEVRELLRSIHDPARGRGWVRAYLASEHVAARREQLRKDLNAQLKLGNTGERGQWL